MLFISAPAKKTKLGGIRMLSKGFIYILGVWVRERGERLGHVKFKGVFVFDWLAALIITIGLKIKGLV